MALSSFAKVAEAAYNMPADSEFVKAKCGACHTGKNGGKLNAFGHDLKGALGGSKKLTVDTFKKIESLDSDKDGKRNGDELRAGTLP